MNKIKLNDLHMDSIEGAIALGGLIREKVFLLKDTGVDSKIFQVWKAKGLVDFIEKGKWARLDIVGYLWLRILETMRKFGCSVKLMKALYDDLFTRAYNENLAATNLESNYNYYKNQSKLRPLNHDESELLQAIEYIKSDALLKEQMRIETSHFSKLIMGSFSENVDACIVIYEDESFTWFLLPPSHAKEKSIRPIDISRPHIYIRLSSYILEFLADADKQIFLLSSGLLSEDEHRVVKEIRNKNVKSITITFKENEHKLEKIECDTKGLIKGEDAKKVMNLLGLKNYSGIELNTRDGKTLSFTHTEKKFF